MQTLSTECALNLQVYCLVIQGILVNLDTEKKLIAVLLLVASFK